MNKKILNSENNIYTMLRIIFSGYRSGDTDMPKNKTNGSFEHFNTGCCEGADGRRDFTIDFSNINW